MQKFLLLKIHIKVIRKGVCKVETDINRMKKQRIGHKKSHTNDLIVQNNSIIYLLQLR